MTSFPEVLLDNWRVRWPGVWSHVALALVAVLCGAIVGAERERRDKPAGLRTLILVCLGSAVFTMVSFAFNTTTGDSGRVAAQIVTGIGFLGAGAILHGKGGVSGMTTAATIWATAAIGMAVGTGYSAAGLGLSILVRMVLGGILLWEIRRLGGMKSIVLELVFDPDHGKTRIRLEKLCEEFHVAYALTILDAAASGTVRARLNLELPRRHLHEFLDALAALPAVSEIGEACVPPNAVR